MKNAIIIEAENINSINEKLDEYLKHGFEIVGSVQHSFIIYQNSSLKNVFKEKYIATMVKNGKL